MSVSLRKRNLVALAGAAVTTLALIAPAASQATVPTPVSSATWNVRTSWVNYVTNPLWFGGFGQGTVTRTASNGGTSTVAPGSATTGYTWPYTNTAYSYQFAKSTDSGTPRTVVLQGGLDFDVSTHGINISIADLKVEANGTGEKLFVDASYVPAAGGAAVPLTDVHAFNVASDGTVTLTTQGAEIFNGGTDERSYETGEAFGSLTYTTP